MDEGFDDAFVVSVEDEKSAVSGIGNPTSLLVVNTNPVVGALFAGPPVLTIRLTATNTVLVSWPSPSLRVDNCPMNHFCRRKANLVNCEGGLDDLRRQVDRVYFVVATREAPPARGVATATGRCLSANADQNAQES